MKKKSPSPRAHPNRSEAPQRIQKVLAEAGVGSRRQIERWIAEGRVIVDGRPAQIGDRLAGKEQVTVDGRKVRLAPAAEGPAHEYLAYYKPTGEITSRDDPEHRRTVFDNLPRLRKGRWITVGRLDINTSGLLILTTDGALAHRLMHPSFEVPRTYAVRLIGELSDGQLAALQSGVMLDDGPAKVESIAHTGGDGLNVWYELTLKEGRNREVRRLFDALGRTVSRLIRVKYGPVALGRMRRGQYRPLSDSEVDALYRVVGMERKRAR